MRHVVSYSRYSSQNQREASIEDQQRKCNQFAETAGLSITRQYSDSAMTGRSEDRPEYLRLKADIENGEVGTLIVDDLSRLSRKSNAAMVIEEFKFHGVRVISVADGIDSNSKSSNLLTGIKAAINSSHRDDMKEKIHRGQEGNALSGKTTGGRFYGYKPVPVYSPTETDAYGLPIIEYGVLEIKEEEARWVREIFEMAAAGKPYQRIAGELNKKGVPSPSGKGWTSSTINSSVDGRPTGILNNKLYVGIKVWNKTEKVGNPVTDKVKKIARDKSQWVTVDMPELRIVSDELWQAVKERQDKQKRKTRQKQAGTHSNARTGRAPGYLFSSILKCGECGANMVIVDKKNYRCGDAHRRGDAFCSNKQKISRVTVESHLLTSIKADLFTPDVIETFREEAKALLHDRKAELEPNIKRLTSELTAIDKKAESLISFIVKQPALEDNDLIAGQLMKLEIEKQEVQQRLDEENAMISSVEPILPRAVERYRELIDTLPDALKDDLDSLRTQVKGLLDEEVVMNPTPDGRWEATYRGSFRGLLRLGGTSTIKISDDALKRLFV